ncbi:MAG: bifunctional nuclease family protein [Spirochaetales bacterium]|nr:bifunctional nuclease family protein [Spirochaetales bacterium]
MTRKNRKIGLDVRGVALDPADADPVVILEDRERRFTLPVPVGPFEAGAIILELEGVKPPRPLTHDLLADFFKRHGFRVDSAELETGEDGSLRASLSYRKGLGRWRRELRPSDAIALALRLKAPLRAAASDLVERVEKGERAVAVDPTRADGLWWLEAPERHEHHGRRDQG